MFLLPFLLPPMRFGTADSAAVCIAIVFLSFLNCLNLAGEVAKISLATNLELFGVFLGVDFMMESRIASRIVVNVIMFHNSSFPPQQGNRLAMGDFIEFAHCILDRNLLCLPWL